MRNELMDHPEIDHALRTGYPRPLPPHITCADCDRELYGDDPVYTPGGITICEDCMKARFEEMDTPELADALGIDRVTAYSRLEEPYE